MKEDLQSIEAYEAFIYSIKDRHPEITTSKLVVVRRGPHRCRLQGTIHFERNIILRIYERLDFIEKQIAYYSYEAYRDESLIYWYDPQPHPSDVTLASTHPHHKHAHPDIKHHRIPAPGLSFDQPKPDEPEPKKKKASRKGAKTRRIRKEFSLRCLCGSAALRLCVRFFCFFAQISL